MSCYKYWGKILEISESLKKYHPDELEDTPSEEFLPFLSSLEEIAHDESIDFDSAKHILENEKMNNALKDIRRFYVKLSVKLETENARRILDSEDPYETLKSFYFYHRYRNLIKNEYTLADMSKKDIVTFIGGGPLPLTLMTFNDLFGIKGISIEQDPELADLSREVLKKVGLESQIRVVWGDERAIEDLEYDVLMVAAFAEPKKRVFSNVKKLCQSKARILYRTYTGMRAILYAPVSDDDIEGFKKVAMTFPEGKVNNTSVLIERDV